MPKAGDGRVLRAGADDRADPRALVMNQVSEQTTTEIPMAKRRKVGKTMNPRLVAPASCGGGAYGCPEIP